MSSSDLPPNMKRKKKRSKAYYIGSKRQKNGGRNVMDVNQKGFFITSSNLNSRACVNEAYSLLGQFADSLYGPEQHQKEPVDETEDDNKDVDVEAQIAAEIQMLNNLSKGERRFQAVECGVKNCVFIKTQIEDPCELAYKILDDIRTTKKSKSRHICRLIPVSVTCRAYVDDIKKVAQTLLPKYFDENNAGLEGKTYSIVFKARCNKNVSREAVYDALNPIVLSLNSANKVELKMPQLAIIVEVMAKFCCLSVVKEYFEMKKYNAFEIAAPTSGVGAAAGCPKTKPELVAEEGMIQSSDKPEDKVITIPVTSAAEEVNTKHIPVVTKEENDKASLGELSNE